jgi:hypothetical protein
VQRRAFGSVVGRGAGVAGVFPLPHQNLAVNPFGVGLAALTARTVVGRSLGVGGAPRAPSARVRASRETGGRARRRAAVRRCAGGRPSVRASGPAGSLGARVRAEDARQRPAEPIDSPGAIAGALGGGPAALAHASLRRSACIRSASSRSASSTPSRSITQRTQARTSVETPTW